MKDKYEVDYSRPSKCCGAKVRWEGTYPKCSKCNDTYFPSEETYKDKLINKIDKRHRQAFSKDFYLWSESGWWLKEIMEEIIPSVEKETRKECMKDYIEMKRTGKIIEEAFKEKNNYE